jgi:two-component system, LytTR family, sensor kinase
VKAYDLIFSRRISHRITRHFVFWLLFLIYFFYVNLLPASTQDLFNSKTYIRSLQLMIYFPVNLLAVYLALNFLLPKFIYIGKYFYLICAIIGLTVFYFIIARQLTILYAGYTNPLPFHQLPVSIRWFLPVRYGIGFPLTSTAMVCIFKLFKNFHLERRENELLLSQKINTELQLIKTKFQPQFLFNALQHIMQLIRNQSAESPGMLLKLSDLLSYVLYENDNVRVPLDKELEIVKTFLVLKKAFYPEALKIHFNQQGETSSRFISPLLLLSIVENCLDSIQDAGINKLYLDLNIISIKNELHFQMVCKRVSISDEQDRDIERKLADSLRRIELLYAGRHSLDLFSENETTYLMLILNLSEFATVHEKEIPQVA